MKLTERRGELSVPAPQVTTLEYKEDAIGDEHTTNKPVVQLSRQFECLIKVSSLSLSCIPLTKI